MTVKLNATARLSVESLETREVPAGLQAYLSGGVLGIVGTSGPDTVAVRQTGSYLTIDGIRGYAPLSAVRRIQIDTGAGNDKVNLAVGTQVADMVFASAGTGTDALFHPGRAGIVSGFEMTFNTGRLGSFRASAEVGFPAMKGEFEVSSTPTKTYNCIAWSLGITSQWINPAQSWAASDQLNGRFGYRRMSTMDFSRQRGVEKIVLYGKVDAWGRVTEFTHQARQMTDGSWSSKLGQNALIRHLTPGALNSATYGVPVAVYYRFNANF